MEDAQQLIDECEQETYSDVLADNLKEEIRRTEFIGNVRDKFQN